MGEGLVGLGHAEDVVLALPGVALLPGCVEDLIGQALRHRVLVALTGELDQPPDRKGPGAAGRHLDRDLVGRPTDPAGADLQLRGKFRYRLLEYFDRLTVTALTDDRQGVIGDLLGHRLLAVPHDLVDHLLDELAAKLCVGLDRPD